MQAGISHMQMATTAEPINSHQLAQATKQEQKQIIGERLYNKIGHLVAQEDIGKITGMMLEMDNSELLIILENEELLATKVNEATSVLRRSKENGNVQTA